MTIKTLEEINEEYSGFKITGRVEYSDKEHETICHLTAKAKGFDDLRVSSSLFRKAYADITRAIDGVQELVELEKKAKSFILIPLDGEGVFSGEIEQYANTEDTWYSVVEPNEVLMEVGKTWEIYGYRWVPVPTGKTKTLTKPQIKKLDKLADQARNVAIEYILTKAKEIIALEKTT